MDVPAEQVWDVLAKFGSFNNNSSQIEHVDLLSEFEQGVGATRKCTLYNGRSVVESVVEWNEGEGYMVEIEGMPLKNLRTSLNVTPIDGSSSKLEWTTTYTPKFGIFGRLMNRAVLSKRFPKIMQREMAAINEYAKTGTPIEKGWRPEMALSNY